MIKELNPYPTLKELAFHSGVEFNTLNKIEKGFYTNIPISVAEELVHSLNTISLKGDNSNPPVTNSNSNPPVAPTIADIEKLYEEHRESIIQKTAEAIENGRIEGEVFFMTPVEIKEEFATWKELRKSLSSTQYGFCEMFAFHQAILQKFEAGNMASFPVGLSTVLEKVLHQVTPNLINSTSDVKGWIKAIKELPRG